MRCSLYRKTNNTLRAGEAFDFLTEVDPERLRLIAAVSLQWNWIEQAFDAFLAVVLKTPSDLWIEVSSRINGFDGKIAIIKAAISSLTGRPRAESFLQPIWRTVSATENYKSIRDHIIHMRLASPDEEVSESYQRRGSAKEVYAAVEPLRAFYAVLRAHWDEVDALGQICIQFAKLNSTEDLSQRQPLIEELKLSLIRLLESQQKRESLPPLPEVPEPAPPRSDQTGAVNPKEPSD